MVEVGEKYSNSICLMKVVPTGFADELNEGWQRKRRGKDASKVFMENQIWFVPLIYQEGSFGAGQVRGNIKGSV